MFFSMYVYALCVGSAQRNQARVLDLLRMELQTVVAAKYVLGTELLSFGGTSSAINC